MQNYYSTKSALDWILGHYFYRKTHYTWLADCFYPYKQPNPKSSNPLKIYEDLYAPWKDADGNDKFIVSSRLNLIKGVHSKEQEGVVEAALWMELRDLCNNVSTAFFYPIVLRVDISKIDRRRRQVAGSGTQGSCEYLITDLAEDEFDVLFLDCERDADLKKIVRSVILDDTCVDSYDVMDLLRKRSL